MPYKTNPRANLPCNVLKHHNALLSLRFDAHLYFSWSRLYISILGCAWSVCVCCMIVISGLATSTSLLIRPMNRHNSDSAARFAPSAGPELATVCSFATAHQPPELIARIPSVSASAIRLCHCCNVLIFHGFTNLKVWLCVVESLFFFFISKSYWQELCRACIDKGVHCGISFLIFFDKGKLHHPNRLEYGSLTHISGSTIFFRANQNLCFQYKFVDAHEQLFLYNKGQIHVG